MSLTYGLTRSATYTYTCWWQVQPPAEGGPNRLGPEVPDRLQAIDQDGSVLDPTCRAGRGTHRLDNL